MDSGLCAVIGGGRMGEAIVAGLLKAGVGAGGLVVAEPDAAKRERLSAAYGVRCVGQGGEALSGCTTVILAVKPQAIDDVVTSLAPALPGGALVVSIAAGVSCARLESLLPPKTAVVRVMPNTPAMAGEGMSVISGGSEALEEHVDRVKQLFSAVGEVIVLPEKNQDAATAISGSGPAYVALFVDALARAGVREGLTREVAEKLALQTVKGTARLLEDTGQHPEQLIDAVCSPGGTTIAALERLEEGGLRAVVASAVRAAAARSKELGS